MGRMNAAVVTSFAAPPLVPTCASGLAVRAVTRP